MSDRLLKYFKYQESNTMNAIETKQNSIKNQNEVTSTIADTPRHLNETDLLDITFYQNAVLDFIRNSDTPITIAFQGEWGCGKTSMMNVIRDGLCKNGEQPYYDIWINSWQLGLLQPAHLSVINVLKFIVAQLILIGKNNHLIQSPSSEEELATLLQKITESDTTKLIASTIATLVAPGSSIIVERLLSKIAELIKQIKNNNSKIIDNSTTDYASNIIQLRDKLSDLITEILDNNNNNPNLAHKKGFIFFIDDLDRIDATEAVRILEIFKNVFDIKNCIFVFAIDYKIVIEGLEPKLGRLTVKNEYKFRAYFDKLIQLPLTLPYQSYDIKLFISENFQKVGYLTKDELSNYKILNAKDRTTLSILADVITHSIGTNPRSLKRYINMLSLVDKYFYALANSSYSVLKKENNDSNKQSHIFVRIIIAMLVCVQIKYPEIYDKLLDNPCLLANLDLSQYQQYDITNTEYVVKNIYDIVLYYCSNNTIALETALRPAVNILSKIYPKS